MRLGNEGDDVGKMQQALIEAGYAVPAAELATKRFSEGTYAALRAFQAAHVGPDGHALAEDGNAGPATLWALEHPGATGGRFTADGWRCLPSEARPELTNMIVWAQGMIGTREVPDGSNRSPVIDMMTGMVGEPPAVPGPPWCAAFVSAAYSKLDTGSPFGRLMSAFKILEWGHANRRVLSTSAEVTPMPGDVFVIMRGDGHGHVGLIVGALLGGKVATIEGNAGNAVRGLVRDRGAFTAIVRPLPV